MAHEHQLDVDPSNAGQVAAWDGNDGAFWAANADRFDHGIAALHLRYLAALEVDPHDRVLDAATDSSRATSPGRRCRVRQWVSTCRRR